MKLVRMKNRKIETKDRIPSAILLDVLSEIRRIEGHLTEIANALEGNDDTTNEMRFSLYHLAMGCLFAHSHLTRSEFLRGLGDKNTQETD